MIDDAAELAGERRRARGRLYATLRWAWDLAALIVRPPVPNRRPPGRIVSPRMRDELFYAWRSVRRRPFVSTVAIASLTLGLGLAILTITVVDAILVRPLRFPRGDELLAVYTEFRPESGATFPRSALSAPEVLDFAAQSRTVDVAAFQPLSVAVSDDTELPERVPASRMTSGAFRVLATPPLLGRVLGEADDRPGASCVVVLGYGFWQERWGGSTDVIGRPLSIDGLPCTIAGVMPAEFAFPNQAARLWLPLRLVADPNDRGSHGLFAVGRLKPGATVELAQQEVSALMARWAETLPHHRGHGIVVAALKEDLVGRVSQELRILAGAVVLLLVSIAANLSSLLLAHGSARRRELAVRSALGAGRATLIRQLLFEGLLLSAGGGIAGGILAWLAVGPALAAYPAALPRASEVHVDVRTVVVAAALTCAVGLVVACLPAIRLTRGLSSAALNTGDRGSGLSFSLRTERALVIGQLAIGVAVSVGALLLTSSFIRLSRLPLGFDATNVTVGTVGAGSAPGRGDHWPQQFFAQLRSEIAAAPGVVAVGAISAVPLLNSPPPDLFTIEGKPVDPPSRPGRIAHYVMITPGTLDTLKIDVLHGRGITAEDSRGAAPVALVNERLARLHWPEDDPIGKRIRYPEGVDGDRWTSWGPWITIVGVVRDIRSLAPAADPMPAIYVPHEQRPRAFYEGRTMGLLVRAATDEIDVTPLVRERMRAIDPRASLTVLRPMDAVVGAAVARPRFMGRIMALFAGIAVGVAALGVYGVVAYAVERRTRELGLRVALGATRGRIAMGVARQTLRLLSFGLVLGLGGAAWLASALRTVLYGVTPFEPAPYLAVPLVLTMVVALAAAVPARRATRVDPLIAMRTE